MKKHIELDDYEPLELNITTKSPWNGLSISSLKEYCGTDPNLDFLDAVIIYNNETGQMSVVIQEGKDVVELISNT